MRPNRPLTISRLRVSEERAKDTKKADGLMARFGPLRPVVGLRGEGARMPSVAASPDDRLDSWKEIAAYLKRGVRTVRRWERDEGLPVHRQVHRVLGSVYAYKSEIDTWRQTSQRRVPRAHSGAHRSDSTPDRVTSMVTSIAVLPFRNLSTDPENESLRMASPMR